LIETLAQIRGRDTRGTFTCGIVLWGDKVVQTAPKVSYMHGWRRDRVRDYCIRREWKITVVTETQRPGPHPERRTPKKEIGHMVKAPFTPEQVEALRSYQESGKFHPFTCANQHSGDSTLLVNEGGFYCQHCDYTQTWAHEFMLGENL